MRSQFSVDVFVFMVVKMLMVSVVTAGFLVSMDTDVDTSAPNFAGFGFFEHHFNAGDSDAVEFIDKSRWLLQTIQQCGTEHIARGTHAAIKIQYSHFVLPIWFIILARYPAPKPLSIFTTLTPLAQELSIESRAASPPKEAP